MFLWIVVFALFPVTSLLARASNADGRSGPATRGLIWTGVALILGLGRVACMAYA